MHAIHAVVSENRFLLLFLFAFALSRVPLLLLFCYFIFHRLHRGDRFACARQFRRRALIVSRCVFNGHMRPFRRVRMSVSVRDTNLSHTHIASRARHAKMPYAHILPYMCTESICKRAPGRAERRICPVSSSHASAHEHSVQAQRSAAASKTASPYMVEISGARKCTHTFSDSF